MKPLHVLFALLILTGLFTSCREEGNRNLPSEQTPGNEHHGGSYHESQQKSKVDSARNK